MSGYTQLEDRLVSAWSGFEPPPLDRITTHKCSECDEIADYFGGTVWYDLTDINALRYHEVALALFAPEAFHYYLPAFMRATLRDPSGADVIPEGIMSSLELELNSRSLRLELFTAEQRRVVAQFLRALPELQVAETDDVEILALAMEIPSRP